MLKAKLIVSVSVIVAALAALLFQFLPGHPQLEARPHEGIGEVLAEEALRLAGGGGRITLIAPDTEVFQYPGAEVQWQAFRRALRAAHVTLAATNLVKLDPLRPPRVPPDFFVDILRKQSDSDVVVSLLGPPLLTAEQKTRLGTKRPRVLAVCSGELPRQADLAALFADNLLAAAIVSRPSPVSSPPASGGARDWFNHYYQLITAKNLADLPAVNAR